MRLLYFILVLCFWSCQAASLEEEELVAFAVEDIEKDVWTVEDTEIEKEKEAAAAPPVLETPLEQAAEDPKPPKLDIVIVVDNSGSMKFILRTIGRKMQTFVETLSLFDYRIGFLNAEVYSDQDKRLMNLEYRGRIITQYNFLKPEMDSRIFIDTLVRGKKDKCDKPPYCGKRKERPLGAFLAYLNSPYREELIREDSSVGLAVILITDNEENHSSRDEPAVTSKEILNAVHNDYSNKIFRAYTLTILDENCQQEIRSRQWLFREGHFAPFVTALAEQTDGRSFSLCLPSYQSAAEQIVQDFLTSAPHL